MSQAGAGAVTAPIVPLRENQGVIHASARDSSDLDCQSMSSGPVQHHPVAGHKPGRGRQTRPRRPTEAAPAACGGTALRRLARPRVAPGPTPRRRSSRRASPGRGCGGWKSAWSPKVWTTDMIPDRNLSSSSAAAARSSFTVSAAARDNSPSSSRWWRKYTPSIFGMVDTHWARPTSSTTSSTRSTPSSAARLAPHEGQEARPLQEKATRDSSAHLRHRTRARRSDAAPRSSLPRPPEPPCGR